MYGYFESNYSRDTDKKVRSLNKSISICNSRGIHGWEQLFFQFSGASFDSGIYRIFNIEEVEVWSDLIVGTFPSYKGQVLPFAFDWLNRVYCVDFDRVENSQPLVLLFSHLTDEVLEIPANLVDFHNEVLVKSKVDVLEPEFFKEVLRQNKIQQLNFSDCIEMKLPLFLGGQYLPINMGIRDRVVDWDINRQLLLKARSIDDGVSINSVTFKN